MRLRDLKKAGLTLGCLGGLALGHIYTWTGDHSTDLWPQELNWVTVCTNPDPALCQNQPVVDGYPDDATDNARILWSLGYADPALTIELSTETIDQLFVSVDDDPTHDGLSLHFTSQDAGGNTLTCDNIVLNPINGTLFLTVKDGAELKTVD